MHLGDIANPNALAAGKPLEGVRILALEQMQALPYATQLLARLGAEVVKLEHPRAGESGRASLPGMNDPEGRLVGATFLRNNLNKRSVGLDLKHPRGREIVLELAPRFDVVAENFKPGTLGRMGLGYTDVLNVHPSVVYLSVSGFGNGFNGADRSPYDSWPAYAPIAEAMSGIYDYQQQRDQPPTVAPVGALGDIGTALFAVIGVQAALRQRDRTGSGQYVDVAMYDAMVAMTDIVTNFWSLGLRRSAGAGDPDARPQLIMDGFRCADGWFIIQVGREHQFVRLAELVGRPDWIDDERFATRAGWLEHLDTEIRPAIEAWAAALDKVAVCHAMAAAGIAAGPCNTPDDVIADPHIEARHMLVEVPRTDDVAEPVLVPGNPVKISGVAEGPETRVPWLGEHTDEVLGSELGFDASTLAHLRSEGVIA